MTNVYTIDLWFEWDDAKNASNLKKHGIDFEDAGHIFKGPVIQRRSSYSGEERWLVTGKFEGKFFTVVYTPREGRIRLISARRAWSNEIREYCTQIDIRAWQR